MVSATTPSFLPKTVVVRAPLIEHNLNFTEDHPHADESFREARVDEYGRPDPSTALPHAWRENVWLGHCEYFFPGWLQVQRIWLASPRLAHPLWQL